MYDNWLSLIDIKLKCFCFLAETSTKTAISKSHVQVDDETSFHVGRGEFSLNTSFHSKNACDIYQGHRKTSNHAENEFNDQTQGFKELASMMSSIAGMLKTVRSEDTISNKLW